MNVKDDVNKMLDYAKRAVDAGNDDDARAVFNKEGIINRKINVHLIQI